MPRLQTSPSRPAVVPTTTTISMTTTRHHQAKYQNFDDFLEAAAQRLEARACEKKKIQKQKQQQKKSKQHHHEQQQQQQQHVPSSSLSNDDIITKQPPATPPPPSQKHNTPHQQHTSSPSSSTSSSLPITKPSSPITSHPPPSTILSPLTKPTRYYTEETAYRLHNHPPPTPIPRPIDIVNSIIKSKRLKPRLRHHLPPPPSPPDPSLLPPPPPLPPAPPLPPLPNDRWSFDPTSRVLMVNCREEWDRSIDEPFFLAMMERDDISLISEGWIDDLNPNLWTRNFLESCGGEVFSHRIRSFRRRRGSGEGGGEYVSYEEVDGSMAMRVTDYVRYLDQRRRELDRREEEEEEERSEESEIFVYKDADGREMSLNCVDVVLYLIDYDIVKLLPALYEDLKRAFKMPGLLPGGEHCMMNAVNTGGRPFMGPNLYLTPPASFTHFHQDGHGTVDSGHICLSGYNEVVMLRRLTESHKRHALHLLRGGDAHLGSEAVGLGGYDALYGLPHADGYIERPMWPTKESIANCEAMNYYPSVCILRPGQFLHINKGCLHAFRKLSPHALPPNDCHAALRRDLIAKEKLTKEQLCLSVAWDWMFQGVTPEGTNREIASILESAQLNRTQLVQSLAIPEACLLTMATTLCATLQSSPTNTLLPKPLSLPKPATHPHRSLLTGLLPSLRHVISRHVHAVVNAYHPASSRSTHDRIKISSRPNTWENPQLFSLDPYGNGDFVCKLCHEELSNVYMHCDGCELILNKDFNICVSCHRDGRYRTRVQMHPLNDKKHSTINHTGDFERDYTARCPCKTGPACKNCGYCAGCSCKCHRWFTLHYRFMTIEDEIRLLRRVEGVVEREVEFSEETGRRLMRGLGWREERKGLTLEEQVENAKRERVTMGKEEEEVAIIEKKREGFETKTMAIRKRKRVRPGTPKTVTSPPKVISQDLGDAPDAEHIDSVEICPTIFSPKDDDNTSNGTHASIPATSDPGQQSSSSTPPRRRPRRPSPPPTQTRKRRPATPRATPQPPPSFPPYPDLVTGTPITAGGIIKGLTRIQLVSLLKLAPTVPPSDYSKIIPKGVTKPSYVPHLIRLFAGENVTGESEDPRNVTLSRREVDVITYFVFTNKSAKECHELMPYRHLKALQRWFNEVTKREYHADEGRTMPLGNDGVLLPSGSNVLSNVEVSKTNSLGIPTPDHLHNNNNNNHHHASPDETESGEIDVVNDPDDDNMSTVVTRLVAEEFGNCTSGTLLRRGDEDDDNVESIQMEGDEQQQPQQQRGIGNGGSRDKIMEAEELRLSTMT